MGNAKARGGSSGALALVVAALLVGCEDGLGLGADERLEPLIVFTSPPEGSSEDEAREIFVVRPDGTGLEQLTEGAWAFAPAWSPDGRKIAFTRMAEDSNVRVMNADGSDLRVVTTGTAYTYHVAWSPDGERLLFLRMGAQEELYTVPGEGGEPTLLRVCPDGCKWPAWSPDGSRIAFVSRPDEGSGVLYPQIFVMALDGSAPEPLETGLGYETQPAWTPDGAGLVFVGATGAGLSTITVARLDGAIVSQVADRRARSTPSLSPDGTRVLFYEGDEDDPQGGGGIYTIGLDGGDVLPVLEFPFRHSHPVTPRRRP